MKPRNARFLDDLLSGTNRTALYKQVRDGHVADISEIVAGIERLLPSEQAAEALLTLLYMLLETRDARGSEQTRKRDRLIEELRAGHMLPSQPDQPQRH